MLFTNTYLSILPVQCAIGRADDAVDLLSQRLRALVVGIDGDDAIDCTLGCRKIADFEFNHGQGVEHIVVVRMQPDIGGKRLLRLGELAAVPSDLHQGKDGGGIFGVEFQ